MFCCQVAAPPPRGTDLDDKGQVQSPSPPAGSCSHSAAQRRPELFLPPARGPLPMTFRPPGLPLLLWILSSAWEPCGAETSLPLLDPSTPLSASLRPSAVAASGIVCVAVEGLTNPRCHSRRISGSVFALLWACGRPRGGKREARGVRREGMGLRERRAGQGRRPFRARPSPLPG